VPALGRLETEFARLLKGWKAGLVLGPEYEARMRQLEAQDAIAWRLAHRPHRMRPTTGPDRRRP